MNMPMLRLGSRGPDVETLQKALNLDESFLARLAEDGLFGPKTHARVQEFQGVHHLSKDGIVGPMTYAELKPLIDMIASLVNLIVPPESVKKARSRIGAIAAQCHHQYGWRASDALYNPLNPRIAGRYRVDKDAEKAHRQGGQALAVIFGVAGADASKCLMISKTAEETYRDGKATAAWRNNHDLPNWCGIFALYVYLLAGLNMKKWQTGHTLAVRSDYKLPSEKADFLMIRDLSTLAEGDLGLADPSDGNHHFVVLGADVTHTQQINPVFQKHTVKITSIDGNAGLYQAIVHRQYGASGVNGNYKITNMTGGTKHLGKSVIFFRPNWNRVLA